MSQLIKVDFGCVLDLCQYYFELVRLPGCGSRVSSVGGDPNFFFRLSGSALKV